MEAEQRRRLVAFAGLAILSVVWGTQFLVIKWGQATLPPLLTAALRFGVLTLAAQLAVTVTRARSPAGRALPRVVFGTAQAVSFGLLYWSQSRIPSGLAGVLSATTPLFVAVLAHRFVAGERLTARRGLALAFGFAGVSCIVLGTRPLEGLGQTLAVVAILVGELAGATNKVIAKRLTADVPAPVLLRDMGLVVTLTLGAASLAFERDLVIHFTVGSMVAFAYLGLVASFAASGLYLLLLRRFTVTAMSYLQFTTATVATAAGVLIGGEHLGSTTVVGVLGVLAGLVVISRGPLRPVESTPEKTKPLLSPEG